MKLQLLDKQVLFQQVQGNDFVNPGFSEQLFTRLHFLGVASGLGAKDQGCAQGPLSFLKPRLTRQFKDHGIDLIQDLLLRADHEHRITDSMAWLRTQFQLLATHVQELVQQQEKFLVMGGDHSCAIGTWSGASVALSNKPESGPLGLLWIDAHMDSHTPETSHTGALHGMPLACLLGYGDPRFTGLLRQTTKLQTDKVCLLGVRSYEPEEAELLDRMGVTIIFMDEIKQQGLTRCMRKALDIVTSHNGGFGISLDLDAIDPQDAPGVGSPTADGIVASQLISNLENMVSTPGFVGMEIAELNPLRDREGNTEQICVDLINHVYAPEGKKRRSS